MSNATTVFTYPRLPDQFDCTILPVDKEKGWSSFQVVKKLRGLLKVRKIGHAGTLDPMATGLLICLVGRATKMMETFMHQHKEYVGTIRLGESTPSYDAETEVVERSSVEHLKDEEIKSVSQTFVGQIEQEPPMYSALKVGGERLYKKARRGEHVERKKRSVTIHTFDITAIEGCEVHFSISCSKGTYIRSIAHDMGKVLGVGGHLSRLRRTAIGDISVDEAWTIPSLQETVTSRLSGR